VPDGDDVVSVINALQDRFEMVVATQDWHPPDHVSFAANHAGKQPFEKIDLAGLDAGEFWRVKQDAVLPVHPWRDPASSEGAGFAMFWVPRRIKRGRLSLSARVLLGADPPVKSPIACSFTFEPESDCYFGSILIVVQKIVFGFYALPTIFADYCRGRRHTRSRETAGLPG
jgi:hypothetical protein